MKRKFIIDVYGVQTSPQGFWILQSAFVAVPGTENGVLEGYQCGLTRRRVSGFREQKKESVKRI